MFKRLRKAAELQTERVSKVPLTRRLWLWSIAAVVLSIALAALAVIIYAAIRTSWILGKGDVPNPDADYLFPVPSEMVTKFYVGAFLIVAGIFLVVFVLFQLWISRRFTKEIIHPLSQLKDAASRISEGDLSGGIAEEGEGEVRELSRSLELMRIKLKESIHMQQRFDENRKFLLSSISHDLKTPVTSIKGYIEGIMDGVATTPEKQAHYLETARNKAIQVNNMIDDLLLYSKLDLNQLPFQFEKTGALVYFTYCLDDYQVEFERDGIKLTLVNELHGDAEIRIDRERFKRVMQNILDNARKHVPDCDGHVELVLRETHTSLIVEVRDNGPGIAEDILPHIFNRFYRADLSRSEAGGSGLGLAIAKQIVEGHGGKIWAASKQGEGTRIMISLKKV